MKSDPPVWASLRGLAGVAGVSLQKNPALGPGGWWWGSGAKSAVFDQPGPEFAGFLAGHLKLAGHLELASAPSLAGADRLRCAAGDGNTLSVGAELEGLAVVEAESVGHGWW